MTSLNTQSKHTHISERIADVGRNLAETFAELVDAVPGRPTRPHALARELSIGRSVSHRLVTAIRKGDPIAAAHAMPGPEPLRRIAEAARQRNVDDAIARRAERAVDEFELLIREQGGDRSGLDAIITAWLPSARERFEKLAKQTAYRGMRQIKGVAADVSVAIHLVHPSSLDPTRCDMVNILGYLGLRCIRPDAQLKFGVVSGSPNPGTRILTLSGNPVQRPEDILWRKYCSQPEVELTVHETPGRAERVCQLQATNTLGPESARDIIMCERIAAGMRRYRQLNDPEPRASNSDWVDVPSKVIISDMIIHADVYRDSVPQLRTLATSPRGVAMPSDPATEPDVLPLAERVEFLGKGMDRFRAEEIPNYVDMLKNACNILGWDPREFRGYRARIEYPVFNSEIQMYMDRDLDPSVSVT